MRTHEIPPYAAAPASVVDEVGRLPAPARRAVDDRLSLLVRTITGAEASSLGEAVDVVAAEVGHRPDLLWLAHSVLAAAMPTDDEMAELLVRARLGGTWAALAPVLAELAESRRFRTVEVLQDAVIVDVQTTASSRFLSGIQRVVRETVGRWHAARDVEFVGWTTKRNALRRLEDDEYMRLLGAQRPITDEEPPGRTVVVPWNSTYLWVEVITDLHRTGRLLALTRYSGNRVGVLGYDSIPITSSTTVSEGMTSHFSRGMAAARRADRVALISDAAAEEFRGVMRMGAGRRDQAPEVAAVPLAVEAFDTGEADLAEARRTLTVDALPMILVVGSHEPRKNHLAVLHAAELLWREGLRFNLVLVGAGVWKAQGYERALASMIASARPVQSIRALPDRLLWAAYRLAHVTLFPSLNEGFGLPVAESLAVGTPVITSGFGSMRDIVAPDGTPLGGLLVDPRDDESVTDALRTVLTDGETYQRLREEAQRHVVRSWDDYADEVWSFLVDGVPPAERT